MSLAWLSGDRRWENFQDGLYSRLWTILWTMDCVDYIAAERTMEEALWWG